MLAEGYRTSDIMQPGMTKVGTDGDDGRDLEGAGEARALDLSKMQRLVLNPRPIFGSRRVLCRTPSTHC